MEKITTAASAAWRGMSDEEQYTALQKMAWTVRRGGSKRGAEWIQTQDDAMTVAAEAWLRMGAALERNERADEPRPLIDPTGRLLRFRSLQTAAGSIFGKAQMQTTNGMIFGIAIHSCTAWTVLHTRVSCLVSFRFLRGRIMLLLNSWENPKNVIFTLALVGMAFNFLD